MFAQISEQSTSFLLSAATRRSVCPTRVGFQCRQAVFHAVIDGYPRFFNRRERSSQHPGQLLVGRPGKREGEQTLFAPVEAEYRGVIVKKGAHPASGPIAPPATFQFARDADNVRGPD